MTMNSPGRSPRPRRYRTFTGSARPTLLNREDTIMRKPDAHPNNGFTLVEILVVVVILGVLAAIVLPQFASATDDARYNAFITDLNALTKAVSAYENIHGLPPDGASGVMPAELDIYMSADRYERETPLGGVWDIEVEENGIVLAVGVHFNGSESPSTDILTRIDEMIDNGDIESGSFREIAANRYYNVLRD
jgi:general secretion pathway protein G